MVIYTLCNGAEAMAVNGMIIHVQKLPWEVTYWCYNGVEKTAALGIYRLVQKLQNMVNYIY